MMAEDGGSSTFESEPTPMSQQESQPETTTDSANNSFEIKNLQQINFEDISLVEKVGHGSYGVVYKAWLKDRFVAVKEFGPAAEQKVIETEIKQLSRVQHENIIALYGKASFQTFEYLIMEYAEGGSLHNFLHGKIKHFYTTAHAISWARQCAEGVAYLHAMKPKPMIHRDLKPLNLLLTNKGRHLKICDFGTVADKSTLMTNNRGSAAWMAPEVFEGNNYTEKCDIFSWAIVLWEVLSRQIPFKEIDNTYSIMWKIHKGVRPPLIKACPEPIQNLMISCWATKPDDRPSMQNVAAVMRALAVVFPGADEALDYEYINQKLMDNNCDDSIDGSKMNSLDFSSFHTVWRSDNPNINSLTPTNSDNNNITSSLSSTHLSEILQLPIAAITSTRWDVIPEENESTHSNAENSDNLNDNVKRFNLSPSTAAAQRYETIRNDIYQITNVSMTPLSVEIDPNGWDFSNSDNVSNLAIGDTKERLTVTNSNTLLPSTKVETTTLLTDDDSLTQLLDPDLQPEPPIPGNAQSEAIYRQHQQLGNEHLRVVTELVYAQDFKEKIMMQMDPAERQQKQELLKKMSEKAELMDLYSNLKQQLEKLRAENAVTVLHGPQNSNQKLVDIEANNTDRIEPATQQDIVAEDGWVVISSQQNT